MTRTRWPERHPRPGWEVDYTVIGGRLKDQGLEGGDSMVTEALDRALSQAFAAATPRSIDAGADVRYWATVCRKIIQRGTRPVLNHRALQGLAPVAVSVESMLRILLDSMGPSVVDPSFDLHPVHEVPF